MPGRRLCRALPCEPCDSPVTRVPGTRAFRSALPVPPTVRHVAGDGGTRVFAGKPQPVEIHHRGIWYAGELVGWRHESDGRVMARVRCVVDNLRHSTWKDLVDLRLPDPASPPRREVAVPAPRRPAAANVLTAPYEDDATRPHVLLAGMRNRPQKPAHATVPPPQVTLPRRPEPVDRPYGGEPLERVEHTPTPLDRRRAYLSIA
jgi:hypothetical protein